MNNIFNSILAVTDESRLFLSGLIQNKLFIGVLIGIGFTLLTVEFVFTQDPKHIPIILRYSRSEAFSKIYNQEHNGTYDMSFSSFGKLYKRIKGIGLITATSFFIMVITILIKS